MKIELKFVRFGGMGSIPIYRDHLGNLWVDLNSSDKSNPKLHKFREGMDDFDDWEYNASLKPTVYEKWKNPEFVFINRNGIKDK